MLSLKRAQIQEILPQPVTLTQILKRKLIQINQINLNIRRLPQFQYHQNWLINLMTSASLNGFRRVSPQMS